VPHGPASPYSLLGSVLVALVAAGLRSVLWALAGVAGLALVAAGVWWVLAHTGAHTRGRRGRRGRTARQGPSAPTSAWAGATSAPSTSAPPACPACSSGATTSCTSVTTKRHRAAGEAPRALFGQGKNLPLIHPAPLQSAAEP